MKKEIMTPKEKAKDLINMFIRVEDTTTFYWEPYYDTKYTDDEVLPHAKKCALVCVEEIVKAIQFDWIEQQNLDREFDYWDEVKNELKKYNE